MSPGDSVGGGRLGMESLPTHSEQVSHPWPFGNAAPGLLRSPQSFLASIPFFVVALTWRALSHRTSSLKGSYVEATWYVLNDQPDHYSLAVGTERVLIFASYHGKT